MIRNAVIFGLGATLLAACTPVPRQGPAPPDAPPPQASSTTPTDEPMEGKPLAPVDVRKLKCSTLMGASDDDKAYATSFLMGYRSALIHSRTIEIKRIEAVEQAALADCNGKPDAFASKIFAAALLRIGPGGELREPPHHAHRQPPSLATPGATTPDQQPPSPDHSSTAPIQYSPTQPMQPPAAAPATPAQLTPPPSPAAPSQVTPPPAPAQAPPSPPPIPREPPAPAAATPAEPAPPAASPPNEPAQK